MFFILGWTLTDECNLILKSVINHTRNIQSKDFERLPYPVWFLPQLKQEAVKAAKNLVARATAGEHFTQKSDEVKVLNRYYTFDEASLSTC